MRSINQYIIEKENKEWKWTPKCISHEKMNEYIFNIHDWLISKYGKDNAENYIQLIKDTYKDFLKADNPNKLSDNKINYLYKKMCDSSEEILKKYGSAQFEYALLPQGYAEYLNKVVIDNE